MTKPTPRYGSDNTFYRGGMICPKRGVDAFKNRMRRGLIVRPGKCEECGFSGTASDGRDSVQAHHDDYNKPFEVRWLCQRCHFDWHQHNRPIAERGDQDYLDALTEEWQPASILVTRIPGVVTSKFTVGSKLSRLAREGRCLAKRDNHNGNVYKANPRPTP